MKLHLSNILTPKMFNQFISDRQARHKLHSKHRTATAHRAEQRSTIIVFSLFIEAEVFGLVKINSRLHEQILKIESRTIYYPCKKKCKIGGHELYTLGSLLYVLYTKGMSCYV